MATPKPPDGAPTKRPGKPVVNEDVAKSPAADVAEAAMDRGAARRKSSHHTEDRRKYLVDVGAVHIIDGLVADLVKKTPSRDSVVSTMRAFLRRIERREVGVLTHAQQATFLIEAAECGDLEGLQAMLTRNADPKASNNDRRTALHAAAENGHLDCAQLLVSSGADVNAKDKWDDHPLDGAINAKHDDMVAFLKEKGATRGPVVAGLAADAEAERLMMCVRLRALAQRGDSAAMKEFLDAHPNADTNAADYDFRTPLHLAAEEGQDACVKLLVERGANVNVKDRWGSSPFRGAVEHGRHGTADLIRSLGAEETSSPRASVADSSRPAPEATLCLACARGDLALVKRLVAEGGDVNEVDYDMRAPLHLAAEEGHLPVVEELVTHGADFSVKDRWGTTPLVGAQKNNHNDVVAYLLDAGASFDRIELQAPAVDFAQLTTDWYESTARYAKLPGTTPCLPARALMARLHVEYGFNFLVHKALLAEVLFLARPRTDPVVQEVMTERLVAEMAEFNSQVAAENFPPEGEDMVVMQEDWTINLMGRNEDKNAMQMLYLQTVVFNKLALPNWRKFVQSVTEIFDEVLQSENDGTTAQYIPELRDADPDRYALSICTAEGQECHFGEHEDMFSVQSTGKTFAYTMALARHGADFVHKYVGQEPSGRAFNDFALTRKGNPFNPVTNAGAIVTCSMLDENVVDIEERLKGYKTFVSKMAGGMSVGDSMDVYHSEQGCAFNNYALANFMRAQNTFPDHVDKHSDISKTVDFYLRVCSTAVNTALLSRVASTYANHGVCPHTGERCMNVTDVKQTLSILYSCGMYDFSGEWACTIGMPAKSGVSGNIFIVVPGVLGLCVWSPKLDAIGNSVRGIRLAQAFSEKFRFSLLEQLMRQ
eukprot:TRINITY_DN1247_c0_g1_i3.p1 TRINITY_DN1247_c0_g1~~TRINITY_DN1247_c0_g1_i3.p1  ORF type:complete len:883 (+),score=327.88 TRINITY_DN1247_c0_g1_i3:39-2687(+)